MKLMSETETTEPEEVPHADDCDHKWELKGGSQSGGLQKNLWQCPVCGMARETTDQKHPETTGVYNVTIYEGWNPKPEPEPEPVPESETNEKKGFWETVLG